MGWGVHLTFLTFSAFYFSFCGSHRNRTSGRAGDTGPSVCLEKARAMGHWCGTLCPAGAGADSIGAAIVCSPGLLLAAYHRRPLGSVLPPV